MNAFCIIGLGFLLYIPIFILNYGGMLAYYQRSAISLSLKNYYRHRNSALFLALPGPFATPGMLLATGFLSYGFKLWRGEKELTLFKKENKYYEAFIKKCDSSNDPEGKCRDFWD